jgi:hypothetical protein
MSPKKPLNLDQSLFDTNKPSSRRSLRQRSRKKFFDELSTNDSTECQALPYNSKPTVSRSVPKKQQTKCLSPLVDILTSSKNISFDYNASTNCTDAGNKLVPVTVEAESDDQQAGMESSDREEFAVLDMNGETVQLQLSNLIVFFDQIAFDTS